MAEAQKKMSVVQLTFIVTVNMMGSGIIMLPANMAQVGAISLLSWLVTAVGSMAIAYGFAQAGIFNQRTGGLAAYAEDAYGTQAMEMLADPASPAPATEREPERYNLVVPRSYCPHCGAPILAHQNIPVISWLLLGGKCASCKARISPRYPIVELTTAILSAAVVWRFGFQWQSVAALFLTWALVALTVIDLDHQILPDVITIPLLWLGLLATLAWQPGLAPPIPAHPVSPSSERPPATSACGACSGPSSCSPARKAWFMATSSCSALWAHGWAGRCCR